MKQLFKDNLTIEQIKEIHGGWENGEAGYVQELLENHGYNLDSIKVMNKAFETLDLLIWEDWEEQA